MPLMAVGVLNGGSATSYADTRRNRQLAPALLDFYADVFGTLADSATGRPKGVTPAFLQPDGTPGPSYLELKIRALLLTGSWSGGKDGRMPAFYQMSSVSNDAELAEAFRSYRNSPWLTGLVGQSGPPELPPPTGIQPMITAFTPAEAGSPRKIFRRTDGSPLPLPGGHGQCFAVLKDVFSDLRRNGYRYAYLGNVDNLGFAPDPLALAVHL